jgi:hypothetical protein
MGTLLDRGEKGKIKTPASQQKRKCHPYRVLPEEKIEA